MQVHYIDHEPYDSAPSTFSAALAARDVTAATAAVLAALPFDRLARFVPMERAVKWRQRMLLNLKYWRLRAPSDKTSEPGTHRTKERRDSSNREHAEVNAHGYDPTERTSQATSSIPGGVRSVRTASHEALPVDFGGPPPLYSPDSPAPSARSSFRSPRASLTPRACEGQRSSAADAAGSAHVGQDGSSGGRGERESKYVHLRSPPRLSSLLSSKVPSAGNLRQSTRPSSRLADCHAVEFAARQQLPAHDARDQVRAGRAPAEKPSRGFAPKDVKDLLYETAGWQRKEGHHVQNLNPSDRNALRRAGSSAMELAAPHLQVTTPTASVQPSASALREAERTLSMRRKPGDESASRTQQESPRRKDERAAARKRAEEWAEEDFRQAKERGERETAWRNEAREHASELKLSVTLQSVGFSLISNRKDLLRLYVESLQLRSSYLHKFELKARLSSQPQALPHPRAPACYAPRHAHPGPPRPMPTMLLPETPSVPLWDADASPSALAALGQPTAVRGYANCARTRGDATFHGPSIRT